MAKKGISHQEIRQKKMMNEIERAKDNKELIDAVQVKLSYIALRSQNASTGIYTKKHMCEMFKSFELDLAYVIKLLNSKGLV